MAAAADIREGDTGSIRFTVMRVNEELGTARVKIDGYASGAAVYLAVPIAGIENVARTLNILAPFADPLRRLQDAELVVIDPTSAAA